MILEKFIIIHINRVHPRLEQSKGVNVDEIEGAINVYHKDRAGLVDI
jgi:hypothetical protein